MIEYLVFLRFRRLVFITFAGVICVFTAGADGGDTSSLEATVQQMQQQMQALQDEVETLRKELKGYKEQESIAPERQPTAAPVTENSGAQSDTVKDNKADGGVLELKSYWDNGLLFKSENDQLRLRFNGTIMADYCWGEADRYLETSIGPMVDGTRIRSMRLSLRGDYAENFFFLLDYNLANGNNHVSFISAYIGLKKIPYLGTVMVGYDQEPFSMDWLASQKDTLFMERSLAFALTPKYGSGIRFTNTLENKRMSWTVGAFFDTVNSVGAGGKDGDYALTGRVTGLPWYKEEGRKLLHLGLAYSYRHVDADISYTAQPETTMNSGAYIDTGTIFAEDVQVLGTEFALVYNWFSVQSEYIGTHVQTEFGSDLNFSGYYVAASAFLTGEHRPYNLSNGTFGWVKPERPFRLHGGGMGAWEVAVRYSSLDLDSGTAIHGGEQEDLTIGLNWYMNDNTKIMLNYIRGDVHRTWYDGDLKLFQTRFQVRF